MSSPSSSTTAPPPLPAAMSPRWRPWSVPVDITRMTREICGLLNRVTRANFDAVSDRIARWAIVIEADGSRAALDTFVQTVFARGVRDPARMELYVALCVRIIDELEGERNLWKRVDLYHVGNPLCSFETVIRLMPSAKFQGALVSGDTDNMLFLLVFLGELLVQGILYVEDVQDVLGAVLERVRKGDGNAAIGLRRFLRPVLKAFNAIHILNSLETTQKIQYVLQTPGLPNMIRYILLSLLDQVSYPQPSDAFNSSQERIEAYGFLSDDGADSPMEMDDEIDMSRLLQSCRERATIFFVRRSHSYAEQALLDLRPEHRHYFFQQLISDVLHHHDPAEARLVGSLWLLETTHRLCEEDHAFLRALEAELFALPDTVLDVPDACHLVATILHETPLDMQMLESLVWQSIPPEGKVRERMLGELRTRELEGEEEEQSRRNRFDRFVRDDPSSSTSAHAF
ncbi:uncharacterized protein PHACADRAFT_125148 [Phanerochaete carnosa HHB-10118-sp]|uniref:MIF4G domain-containing protein n=1 Tax=Phanerochaete carnosa (strain HHB-10118-sp) TaxID=650164 RepID=K5W3D1_PHACS|nr:uncharacterized protein PHACADRAFT_125148 [Phanerochaete carnosa HHB-10118-sp]EKM53424.1 hypothetical protein PHACADRAFT_125148 [Phanerochaete carnosa HHB-10118-sp]